MDIPQRTITLISLVVQTILQTQQQIIPRPQIQQMVMTLELSGMASAPSMSAYSQDLCLVGISGGISTIGFGVSCGTYKTDENCENAYKNFQKFYLT